MPKYSTSIEIAPLTEAYKARVRRREWAIDVLIYGLAVLVIIAGVVALVYTSSTI